MTVRRKDDLARDMEARIPMNDLRLGRPEAIEELVNLLAAPLHRFVSRVVGQEADAEDVLQTVFERVVRDAERFRGSHDGLRSWVFTLAYRASIDVLRARRRALSWEDRASEIPGAEPADLETPAADVRRAFADLEPRDQTVLTLKFQDDFSNPEIARILGLDANHVGVLVWRAKQNLRRALP